MWQGCPKVKPTVLIGSCFLRIFHTDRFHGNGHRPYIFVRKSWQISNKQVAPTAIK